MIALVVKFLIRESKLFMPLLEVSQRCKFESYLLAQAVGPCQWIVQNALGDRLMGRQKPLDIIFEDQLRM